MGAPIVTAKSLRDPAVIAWIQDTLVKAGYEYQQDGDTVRMEAVGSHTGDRSVTLTIELQQVDEVKFVRFVSQLQSSGGSFANAMLAATRGNRATFIPRFEVIEALHRGASVFHVVATFTLYADHLSSEEFIAMLGIYLHEVDSIDNELISIIEDGE
jgi:hypothetical protein